VVARRQVHHAVDRQHHAQAVAVVLVDDRRARPDRLVILDRFCLDDRVAIVTYAGQAQTARSSFKSTPYCLGSTC